MKNNSRLDGTRSMTFPVKPQLTINCTFSRTETRFHAEAPKPQLFSSSFAFFRFRARFLVVVFESQVGDQILAAQMPERIFQFHELNENVVLGIQSGCSLRRFEVERKPLLYPFHPGPLSEIEKKSEIQNDRRCED